MKTIEKFVKQVVSAAPTETVAAICRLMEQHNVGAVVVVEQHKPVGIVTDRDICLKLGAHGVSPQTRVGDVMHQPVTVVNRDEGVFDTTQSMREAGVRRLPVVDDDGWLVGLVTLDDLLRLLVRELSNVVEGISQEMEIK